MGNKIQEPDYVCEVCPDHPSIGDVNNPANFVAFAEHMWFEHGMYACPLPHPDPSNHPDCLIGHPQGVACGAYYAVGDPELDAHIDSKHY